MILWLLRSMTFFLIALLAGCGDPVGTPCTIKGSGFTASQDCQHRCLSHWHVICPDGEPIKPKTCSGKFGCVPGGCPQGQVCYHDVDPFDDRSFCVAANTCGDLDAAELQAWELTTVAQQNQVIAERLVKQARQKKWQEENPDKVITSPAQKPPPGGQ